MSSAETLSHFRDDIVIFGDIFSCKTEIKVASETATGGVR